jgi:hypothetical protein
MIRRLSKLVNDGLGGAKNLILAVVVCAADEDIAGDGSRTRRIKYRDRRCCTQYGTGTYYASEPPSPASLQEMQFPAPLSPYALSTTIDIWREGDIVFLNHRSEIACI